MTAATRRCRIARVGLGGKKTDDAKCHVAVLSNWEPVWIVGRGSSALGYVHGWDWYLLFVVALVDFLIISLLEWNSQISKRYCESF